MIGFRQHLIEMAMPKDDLGWEVITTPKKSKGAYKLFTFKNGKIYPLFIGTGRSVPIGKWVGGELLPTKGFKNRGGWHCGEEPITPQLKTKKGNIDGERIWAEIKIDTTNDLTKYDKKGKTLDQKEVPVKGFYKYRPPSLKGGFWYLTSAIKVIKLLGDDEAAKITGRITKRANGEGYTKKTLRKMGQRKK